MIKGQSRSKSPNIENVNFNIVLFFMFYGQTIDRLKCMYDGRRRQIDVNIRQDKIRKGVGGKITHLHLDPDRDDDPPPPPPARAQPEQIPHVTTPIHQAL